MNSTSSLIITALLLVVAAVVIGCESDQKTNTAPSVVTVGTVYANMTATATATANSDQTTNLAPIPATPSGARTGPVDYATSTSYPSWAITSGNSATASARAEALRGADRNKVPSCFPNCPTPVPTAPLPTPLPTNTAQSISTNVDEKFHFLEQVNLMKQEIAKSGADYENAILDADYAATRADELELIDLMETINQDVADRYESSILRLDSLPVPDDLEYFEFVNTQKSAWRTAELAYRGCVASWRIARLDLNIGLSATDDCLSAIEDAKSYLMDAQSDYENLVNAFNRSKYIKR